MPALEPDLLVVGEAAHGQAVLDLAATAKPDVIVMDLTQWDAGNRRGGDDVGAGRHGRDLLGGDAQHRRRALASGASAYVEKGAGMQTLLQAIRTAAARVSPPQSPELCDRSATCPHSR